MKFVFTSSNSSFSENKISVLALLEIIIGHIVLFAFWDILKPYLLLILIGASTTFLRTDIATQRGIKMMEDNYRKYREFYKSFNNKFHPNINDKRYGIYLPGAALFARFHSVFTTLLTNPVRTITAIGDNWKKNVLCVDLLAFYEFVPGWRNISKQKYVGITAIQLFRGIFILSVLFFIGYSIKYYTGWEITGWLSIVFYILIVIPFSVAAGWLFTLLWLRVAPKISFIAYSPLIFSSKSALRKDFKELVYDIASLSYNNKPPSPFEIIARKVAIFSCLIISIIWAVRFSVPFFQKELLSIADGVLLKNIIFPNGRAVIPLYEVLILICSFLTFCLWLGSSVIARKRSHNYHNKNWMSVSIRIGLFIRGLFAYVSVPNGLWTIHNIVKNVDIPALELTLFRFQL